MFFYDCRPLRTLAKVSSNGRRIEHPQQKPEEYRNGDSGPPTRNARTIVLSEIMSTMSTLRCIFIDVGIARGATNDVGVFFADFVKTFWFVGVFIVTQIIRVLEMDHFIYPCNCFSADWLANQPSADYQSEPKEESVI